MLYCRLSGFILMISFCIFAEFEGFPIRYIGGCEIDLNNDSISDRTILIETKEGVELIALLSEKENKYKTQVLYRGKEKNLFVNCEFAKVIQASAAVKEKRKTYTINSFVIRLSQPEGSSSVFFWKNGKFEQVWTSD